MGILADHLRRRALADRNQASAVAVQNLLGQAPTQGGELGADGVGPPAPKGLGGSGLLGSASLDQGQRDQLQFAGGLLGDPGLRDVGSSLFRGVFSDSAAMARQQSSNVAAGERGQGTADTALQTAELRRDQTQANFERTFQQKATTDQLKRDAERRKGLRGPVEAGHERLLDPTDPTGQTVLGDRMVAGSTPARNAEKAAVKTRDTMGLVDKVIKQIGGADGFEAFGRIQGEMASIFNQLIAFRLKVREFGAPQAGEFEFLERELDNFSKLSIREMFDRKGKVLGQLAAYRDELNRSFDSQRSQTGHGTAIDSRIPGLIDDLPLAPASFEAAAAEGLTPVDRGEIEGRTRSGGGLLGGGLDPDEELFGNLGGGA